MQITVNASFQLQFSIDASQVSDWTDSLFMGLVASICCCRLRKKNVCLLYAALSQDLVHFFNDSYALQRHTSISRDLKRHTNAQAVVTFSLRSHHLQKVRSGAASGSGETGWDRHPCSGLFYHSGCPSDVNSVLDACAQAGDSRLVSLRVVVLEFAVAHQNSVDCNDRSLARVRSDPCEKHLGGVFDREKWQYRHHYSFTCLKPDPLRLKNKIPNHTMKLPKSHFYLKSMTVWNLRHICCDFLSFLLVCIKRITQHHVHPVFCLFHSLGGGKPWLTGLDFLCCHIKISFFCIILFWITEALLCSQYSVAFIFNPHYAAVEIIRVIHHQLFIYDQSTAGKFSGIFHIVLCDALMP